MLPKAWEYLFVLDRLLPMEELKQVILQQFIPSHLDDSFYIYHFSIINKALYLELLKLDIFSLHLVETGDSQKTNENFQDLSQLPY